LDAVPYFTEVYDCYVKQIYAYCLRRLPPGEAQDAAADVFTVVWRRWEDRPVHDEILPWIYGIARNVVSNHHRTIRRRANLIQRLVGLRPSGDPDPESTALVNSEHVDVLRALSKLSANDQETLRLVEWEGLSRDEVAVIFGVSRSAIDQRMSRAQRRLGTLLRADVAPGLAPSAIRFEGRQ
jgi:RNA polymerase sigma-70 factor (ECF subfamily)